MTAGQGIQQRLAQGAVLGAEGYVFELERRGYIKAGPYVPEVVLDFPGAVRELHREFLRAGADVMVALTYYAHREKLRDVGREGDLEALPYSDGAFDVVTGFNSFQYAGNPIIALGEARRVVKSDGKLVIMTWGDPAKMEAASLVTVLRPLMPPPPPGAPGPFALSDETALRKFATDAKLSPIKTFDVDSPFIYADEETGIRALNSSGVAVRAMDNTSEAAVTDAHRKALAPFRQKDGSYRVSATFRCLLAKP